MYYFWVNCKGYLFMLENIFSIDHHCTTSSMKQNCMLFPHGEGTNILIHCDIIFAKPCWLVVFPNSMNIGKSRQLGMHGFGSFYNLTWLCYPNGLPWFDTYFISQMKLITFHLIHCFTVIYYVQVWFILVALIFTNLRLMRIYICKCLSLAQV